MNIRTKLRIYFRKLSKNKINQNNGHFYPKEKEPCCVGAHIASSLKTQLYRNKNGKIYRHYLDGKDKFYDEMLKIGFNARECFITLRICGAGPEPFDIYKWPKEPRIVFSNLAKFEKPITEKEYDKFTDYYRITDETSIKYNTTTLYVGKDQWTYSHYMKDYKGKDILQVKVPKKYLKRNPEQIKKGEK